jgi:hypothetical protein
MALDAIGKHGGQYDGGRIPTRAAHVVADQSNDGLYQAPSPMPGFRYNLFFSIFEGKTRRPAVGGKVWRTKIAPTQVPPAMGMEVGDDSLDKVDKARHDSSKRQRRHPRKRQASSHGRQE